MATYFQIHHKAQRIRRESQWLAMSTYNLPCNFRWIFLHWNNRNPYLFNMAGSWRNWGDMEFLESYPMDFWTLHIISQHFFLCGMWTYVSLSMFSWRTSLYKKETINLYWEFFTSSFFSMFSWQGLLRGKLELLYPL